MTPLPPGRFRRRLLLAAAATLALLALLAAVAVLWVRSALPDRSGTFVLEGLGAPVDVLWDRHAVPHVWAGSLEDALFAQGFLHARDRLWQMDLVRRAIQGRLAEVMGEAALDTDRFMRRLGLWESTVTTVAGLGPVESRLLQRYADGVNAAIDGWSGAWPPEFLVLGYEPEPWTPRHTLAVSRMMSFTLSSYAETVSVARAVRALGEERASYLFPGFPEWGATILEAPTPDEPPPLAAALIDGYSVATASNAWAVSGRLTRSGKPLLANDPHLGLQAPSLWYLMGLHADRDVRAARRAAPAAGHEQDRGPDPDPRALDVVGATIPGAPLVILGHNRAIAWGMTNAYVDDADLFIERLDPTDAGRYLVPGGSARFEVRAETIQVKGREAPEVMEVRLTRHGPVMPAADGAPDSVAGSYVLAVQWTALRPTSVVGAVLRLNRAHDWPTFVDAADAMDDPHQNLVYADTAGHIGFYMGGNVPIRGARRPAPTAPVPGWTGEWDWSGDLPFAEHPHVLDPPAGFVVTANNRQTADPVGDLISGSWQEPFRAMRITEMLAAGRDYTAADMLAMQMDVLDVLARRWLHRAVDAARDAGEAAAADRLAEWDARADAASPAAPIFYAWYEILRRAAARDLYRGRPGYFPRNSADEVLERAELPWRESGGAAYRRLAREAMREAVALSDGMVWRQANRVVHEHALGDVALLDRLLGLDVGPEPHHGAPTTVNVAHYAFRSPADDFPFTTTAAASMRHVADLGNLDGGGGFVIGTGQAGVPFSRLYRDQVERWKEGGLIPVPLGRDAVERLSTETMTLRPDTTG